MQVDETKIAVNVYAENNGVHYAKVTFQGIGLYINSFTVRVSPKYPEAGLWVQEPKYNVNGKWVKPVEFNKNSHLWKLVEERCRQAAENYIPSDTVITEIENINWDKIPY